MTAPWSIFRLAPTPTTALPFGVRSTGRHYHPQPRVVDNLPPRRFTQLYWVAAGRVCFTADAGDTVCGPGEIYVYPIEMAHRVRTLEPETDYWWVTIDGPLGGACVDAFGLRPPWPKRAGSVPERLFERMAGLLRDPSPASERAAAAVCWELISAAASPGDAAAPPDDAVELLRRQLVDRAGDSELSVARLAAELGLDRSVLTRRFTRVVGVAPKPYLQSIRLSRAMSLLHATDTPISVIAGECGFADPGYFARAFRSHTGQTPERFRRG